MHLQLVVVVVQLVAYVLLVHASDSTNLADALFRQTSVKNTKVDTRLQSNVTHLEDNSKEDLEEVLSQLLQTNQEVAQEQFNQLSLVTRYTGTGYNLVRGNPEGDFNYGGVDPGIKTTKDIFRQTYRTGKRAYYLGKSIQVPDQVTFLASQSCAQSHSVKAYSGRKSYMKELETSLSISGGFNALFASVSFSLSAGMARVKAMTERKKNIVIQKNTICNYGRARYLYENAVARENGYTLSRSFNNSVKYQLPTFYDKKAYMQFIEKWGTHIIVTVDVGAKEILRSSSTYTQVYKYLKKRYSLSTRAKARYKLFSASRTFMIKTLNENINQNTHLGKSWKKVTIGSKSVPQPIHLDLKIISKALDRNWWGSGWRRYGIDKKQRNLIKALKEYPAFVNAMKNKDPLIKFKLSTHWPDGRYALPMATWGCPRGWSSGWRYQDTEGKSNRSPGIHSKMRIHVGRDGIRFYYCVKTIPGNSGVTWPKGTYCIASHGSCPQGFFAGGMKWDDENRHNKNKRWGVLPSGVYGRDTTVLYCCRSDGNHYTPMALPTNRSFILYRYGGQCQRVRGMNALSIWVLYDDENRRNRDKCWGGHPDATCRRNQLLNMCYYKK